SPGGTAAGLAPPGKPIQWPPNPIRCAQDREPNGPGVREAQNRGSKPAVAKLDPHPRAESSLTSGYGIKPQPRRPANYSDGLLAFGPSICWIGSRMKRPGSFVQALRMYS